MKKSTLVRTLSIASTVVLAAIGLTLIIMNQMGTEGHLANWPINVWTIYVAYGCILGPVVIFIAIGLLRSGINKSDDLHAEEARAERVKKAKKAKAAVEKAFDDAAWEELAAAHPELF